MAVSVSDNGVVCVCVCVHNGTTSHRVASVLFVDRVVMVRVAALPEIYFTATVICYTVIKVDYCLDFVILKHSTLCDSQETSHM